MAAVNTHFTLTNADGGYLCEGKDIKGGYFVIDKITNIPSRIAEKGSLCYCINESKFYQFNGTTWTPANLGGGGGEDATEVWTFTLEDGSTVTKNIVTALGAGSATEEWVFTCNDGSTITKKVVIE